MRWLTYWKSRGVFFIILTCFFFFFINKWIFEGFLLGYDFKKWGFSIFFLYGVICYLYPPPSPGTQLRLCETDDVFFFFSS